MWTWVPSTRPLICLGRVHASLPFGPSALTAPSPEMVSFTLAGSSMIFLPIRDITRFQLPNDGEQFATDVLLLGFAAADDALRGGKDGDAHAAEHARDFRGADILAQAGLAYALEAGDGRGMVVFLGGHLHL